LIECDYVSSSVPYFDRLDYVSNVAQELLMIIMMERLMGSMVYVYCSLIRTLLLELYRILNHCLAITTHAIDIGLFSIMLVEFEEREKIMNFVEVMTGTRFHVMLLLVSRLRYDVTLQ
jgi:NADH:ubiquinone oxidoreductase subunit D